MQTLSQLDWKSLLVYIALALIMRYVLPFLKQQAEAAAAKSQAANLDKTTKLLSHMQNFLYVVASTIVEREFPTLAQDVVNGKIKSPDDAKQVLHGWGDDLKTEVIDYFQHQGIDLVGSLGEPTIERMVEDAANRVSPFPGKETSKALFEENNALKVLAHGVHGAQVKALDECRACIPPCDQCPLNVNTAKDQANDSTVAGG